MRQGLIALLLIGLLVVGCSETADDAADSTTTTATESTTTTVTTTTEAPEGTVEAQQQSWPVPLAYQDAIYDPVTDSILLAGGIRGDGSDFSETYEVWELDVATTTFERRSDIPFSYGCGLPHGLRSGI